MRKYRETLTEDQLIKRRKAVKKCVERYKKDPIWIAKQRKRLREYTKKKRQENPEWKKLCYQRHTEWARKNREHINKKQRERNKNPEYKLNAKKRILKNKYGITYEEYQSKIQNNNGCCPICCQIIGDKAATDHNHNNGKVRDIICRSCNLWIGFIEKNRNLIQPMLNYLNKWDNIQQTK